MPMVQNPLDFISGYSFCDINRDFAYQNRAKFGFLGRILAENRALGPKIGQ
jgi:hypothetical protein